MKPILPQSRIHGLEPQFRMKHLINLPLKPCLVQELELEREFLELLEHEDILLRDVVIEEAVSVEPLEERNDLPGGDVRIDLHHCQHEVDKEKDAPDNLENDKYVVADLEIDAFSVLESLGNVAEVADVITVLVTVNAVLNVTCLDES